MPPQAMNNGPINGASPPQKSNSTTSEPRHSSRLRPLDSDDTYDLVCVGFGPAGLSIAIALHDALDAHDALPNLTQVRRRAPKVLFVEKQPRFTWHEGMLLPGAKMQISFLKDLATLRNPQSAFTFINYLHKKRRLLQFSNLGTFLPSRVEYQDYMNWCADWFTDIVQYGHEVIQVRPLSSHRDASVSKFYVEMQNTKDSGSPSGVEAKNVVIAVGGRPAMPIPVPEGVPHIIHSSQYTHSISTALPSQRTSYSIAVIGAGQSAAEIFNDLHSRYPNAFTSLIIKGSALRPSDDSPFVNEIFDPSSVDSTYYLDPTARKASIAEDRCTNYGVVRLELLERIYHTLYEQRVHCPDESKWHHHILPNTEVVHTEIQDNGLVALRLRKIVGGPIKPADRPLNEQKMVFDAVIMATGYQRDQHYDLLTQAEHLRPAGSNSWEVYRDYCVKFRNGAVADGSGIWLQGCNESTHGLSDTLLSVLATRGGEIVGSIFGDS